MAANPTRNGRIEGIFFTVAIAPGHTATALNNFKGRQTVEVRAQWITSAILNFKGPSGVFIEKDKVHSW